MPGFRRNYKPVYPMTNEELMEKVSSILNDPRHDIYIMANDQPYNMYGDEDGVREVKTHHLVMRYTKSKRPFSSDNILQCIDLHTRIGYHVFENSSGKKSIELPHFHLIKIID